MQTIYSRSLDNGLKLIVAEEHSLPIVCSTIWYRVGARLEVEGKSGLSHFLEHMMFKGTKKYPKGSIDKISLSLGGNNNAFTSYDYTGYYMTFSSDRWEISLDIESDRMQNLLLRASEFDAEKQVVFEELKMGEDNPWGYLRKNVTALAFRRHPYRRPIIGWREDLEALQIQDMEQFYRRYYQPGNSFLVITGDVKADHVFEKINKKFGQIQGIQVDEQDIFPESPSSGVVRFHASKPSNVSRLLMAFHGPSVHQPEIYAANVLKYILSEGKTSRIHHRLVEKDQTVSSFAIYFEDMKDPSLFMLGVELKDGGSFQEVEDAVFEELKGIRTRGVTESELRKAHRQLQADCVFEREDISSLAINLGLYECIDSYRFYESFLDKVSLVTAEDIQAVADAFLHPERCTIGHLEARKDSKSVVMDGEHSIEGLRPIQGYGRIRSIQKRRMVSNGIYGKGVGIDLPIEAHQLGNGLTVMVCPLKRIPAVTMSAVVLAGSREDEIGREGLAYMLGNMLDEGTSRHNHHEIASFIDNVGGEMNTFGARESSGVTMKLLKEDLSEGLSLLQEMLFQSTFPEERIELTRSHILTRLSSLEDRPDYIGSREFNRIIYKGTPLQNPTMGYHQTVKELNRDGLWEFYSKYYNPSNTVLVLVGDLDPEDILNRVTGEWGGLPAGNPKNRQPFPFKLQKEKIHRTLTFKEKEQLHLFLGHLGIRRNNPDFYKLLVMDIILGSGPGFTSRIPKNLRDEMGLAYSTYASICSTAGLDEGRFTAYIGTSPANRDIAVENMIKEIKQIQQQKVSQEELAAAKDYLTGSFVFKFETMFQIAAFMMTALIHGLGFDYIEKFPRYIQAVTRDDILDVARKYLHPDHFTLVEVRPEK